MSNYFIGQKILVINAIGPTIAIVTEPAGDIIRAKLENGGGPYEYTPDSIRPATEKDIEDARAYSQWAKERLEQQLRPAPFTSSIPEQAKIDTDWVCEECGHVWNGPKGKQCPRCGETEMIHSPHGRV